MKRALWLLFFCLCVYGITCAIFIFIVRWPEDTVLQSCAVSATMVWVTSVFQAHIPGGKFH